MPTTIVLDNGGGLIKVAKLLTTPSSTPPTPLIVPNALARPAKNAIPILAQHLGKSRRPATFLAAAEILSAPDINGMSFRRPHDRGVVTQWDLQRDIWASVFADDVGIGVGDFADAQLLVTEPLGVPLHMRKAMDELVFEEFGFGKYCAAVPQRLTLLGVGKKCGVVLDTGFSFSHAVPVIEGKVWGKCARRLNVGGKLLTNFLKEMVSFRSVNMMEETVLMNTVKERLCYVSMSFVDELRETRERANDVAREYALPDVGRGGDKFGYVLEEGMERDGTEQILPMTNERISVPEILFNPSDVGMEQAGVAELIFQAVQACPEEFHADLYANVVLTGGNCNFPNFRERVEQELRPLVCEYYDVIVFMDDNPITSTFNGGVKAATKQGAGLEFVTKEFYHENGSNAIIRKFYEDRENSSNPLI